LPVAIPMVWPKSNNLELDVEELIQYMTTTNDSGPLSCSSENKNSSESSPSNQHYHEHSYDLGDEDEWFSPTEIISTPTNVHEQRNLSL
jgi:hypothetical protein